MCLSKKSARMSRMFALKYLVPRDLNTAVLHHWRQCAWLTSPTSTHTPLASRCSKRTAWKLSRCGAGAVRKNIRKFVIENTPIVSWNFDLVSRVIIRSISTLFRSSTFQYDLSVKLSNKRSKTRQIASVVNTVHLCRSFGFWLKLASNCKMLNKHPLSDTQNWHHWIAESSPSKAIYNTWLHIAEKFVLKRF